MLPSSTYLKYRYNTDIHNNLLFYSMKDRLDSLALAYFDFFEDTIHVIRKFTPFFISYTVMKT